MKREEEEEGQIREILGLGSLGGDGELKLPARDGSRTNHSFLLFLLLHVNSPLCIQAARDHLPLWMQVRTDIEGFKLEQVVRG